jgi:pantoate--beta-alanine ligase
MRIYHTRRFLKAYLSKAGKNKVLGFVPTMGALHEGHLSLVQNARKKCDIVVVSIFVNPTQFDRKEDLDHYPVTIENDLELLKKNSCDAVFIPKVKEIYQSKVEVVDYDFDGLDRVMEGAHRKGHFAGVGTVVKKLFDIVQPDYAFFGEKDFQQLQIIKKMVEKEKIPVKIIGNPIHRESDGLAMSSRNVRLTSKHRKEAFFIYHTLQEAQKMSKSLSPQEVINWVYQVFAKNEWLELEYFSIANEKTLLPISAFKPNQPARGFIAVFAGKIRLIDNMPMG